MNKIKKTKIIFLAILFFGFFGLAKGSQAATYWVSSTGTAAWNSCSGATPLSGTSACALSTTNANAAAGDVVYLRAGTYTITVNGIAPVNSGSDASHRIEYSNYNDEDVTIQSGAASRYAILLNAVNWIYVHGSVNHPLILLNNDYHIELTTGASHNEISYVTTIGSYTTPSPSTGSGVIIIDASNYNWFHHSTFTGHGGQDSDPTSYFDGHYPFIIGGEGGGIGNIASYNLIENNEFKNGGHDVATDNGKFNIWRNNFMHHELYLQLADYQWQQSFTNGSVQITVGMVIAGVTSGVFATVSEVTVTSGSWGGGNAAGTLKFHYVSDNFTAPTTFSNGETLKIRNQSTNLAVASGSSAQIADYGTTYVGYHVFQSFCNDGGYNLFENNIIGFGAENLNPSNYAGNGIKINTPRNITRYNQFLGNWLGGINLVAYGDSKMTMYPTENYIYNNTTLGNGVHPSTYNGSPAVSAKQHAVNFDIDSKYPAWIANNVVKNNLLAEYFTGGGSTCQGATSGIWEQNLNTSPTGQIIGTNWDTCSDHTTYNDPKFISATMPAYNAMNLTRNDLPDLSLQSSSPVIDKAPYLTTATRTNNNVIALNDAKYFFDATPYTSQFPLGAAVQSDYICFSTSSTTVNLSTDICKQIESISGNNITITNHGLLNATTYYVWLYKRSDGTQVLHGSAPDYGAYEYASSSDTTPPAAPSGLNVS